MEIKKRIIFNCKQSFAYLIGIIIIGLFHIQPIKCQFDSTLVYAPGIVAVISANATIFNDEGPINKLETKAIDLQFHRQYNEILNSIPGITMQSGALNTNRISIRGVGNRSTFSTTKVKAYLDNIPLTTGIGETTLEDLDLGMLESIEVSKGPTDVAMGSNLGGLIHFRTFEDPVEERWTLRSQVGSYGTYQLSNTLQLNPKSASLWIGQQYFHSNGFRDNNEYDRWHLFTYFKKQFDRSKWSVFANYIDLNAEIPSALNIEDFDSDPRKAADNWKAVNGNESYSRVRIAINHNYDLKQNAILYTTLSGQYYNAYEVRPFNILDDQLMNIDLRTGIENWSLGTSNWKIDTGIELFSEAYNFEIYDSINGAQGDREEKQSDNRASLNYYLQINNSSGNWNWTIASSAQWFQFNRANKLQDLQESNLNFNFEIFPHFTLAYQGLKNNRIQLILSRGLSIPNFEESLLPDGSLNPDIAIEKGWNSELVYQHTGPNKNAQFTGQIYSMYITDILVSRRTAEDAFFSINAGSAWMRGVELSFSQIESLRSKNTSRFPG